MSTREACREKKRKALWGPNLIYHGLTHMPRPKDMGSSSFPPTREVQSEGDANHSSDPTTMKWRTGCSKLGKYGQTQELEAL
ncbi:unnamed protein product [Prunus armeniaca]